MGVIFYVLGLRFIVVDCILFGGLCVYINWDFYLDFNIFFNVMVWDCDIVDVWEGEGDWVEFLEFMLLV